ncbi:putative flavoprotein involved in K+ transport [Saccharopolyspora antimicrobica]|uniref:Flavoprotein involved in K+ transport n=1 Tax=Saccharopolyspora antimicrobica TaxID=455193 RepID=A0A1I5FJJ3_9PSEU|nr:ArsO family NAD(P)H-dependent flavin-containing monooxygenase [Saccharopolyspora antimicrobica]RKT82186.1 putative flavoprotein involved in K+ transport [Saccharopolyspora antimicrobica]SFO23813.1 putative flavoprotein involved in K+ transport [Saccharopolyspora antimicrobica]
MTEVRDVVVIGGGQAGLAVGYFLRRAGVDFVVLDDQPGPGGAWRHCWDSLRLFSPAEYSPLPGWWMPRQPGEEFPTAEHVAGYLAAYEQRYDLPVRRPVRVRGVHDAGAWLAVQTDQGAWRARIVISATGTWGTPHLPSYPGQELFAGRQLHTTDYRSPQEFAGQRVVVVGGGNSAAQILAEVSTVAATTWVTRRAPRFMPDDVDGRVLFDVATQREAARRAGLPDNGGTRSLGDIVMLPAVRDARDRGVLRAEPMFGRLTEGGVGWDGVRELDCDAIIWCTGFRPDLGHLAPLGLEVDNGVVPTEGTRCLQEPRLHLLGYGDWTGWAAATLVGASRIAKTTAAAIAEELQRDEAAG